MVFEVTRYSCFLSRTHCPLAKYTITPWQNCQTLEIEEKLSKIQRDVSWKETNKVFRLNWKDWNVSVNDFLKILFSFDICDAYNLHLKWYARIISVKFCITPLGWNKYELCTCKSIKRVGVGHVQFEVLEWWLMGPRARSMTRGFAGSAFCATVWRKGCISIENSRDFLKSL